jgi:GTP-binding protein EngB required for normal cell division
MQCFWSRCGTYPLGVPSRFAGVEGTPLMDLQQYDRMKSVLADILRSTQTRLPSRGAETVRDLFGRLAEDRFNLVVVGRFSRGKTSLMNAMLGTDRLPTGVVPVTSVITTVSYGTEEKAVLYYQHTSLFLDIPLWQLADHITEQGNPGNRRRIRVAEVQMPAELLRRGFYFVDTPGLGSSIIENTRTTEAFLPEADAFILVTSYDSPLSDDEQRVLRIIHGSRRRVFVLVNKQDSVDSAQREEVHEHLQVQLAAVFGDAVPPLFPISARQGLEARLRTDPELFASSGLLAFEATLLRFLVDEKRGEFLQSMCNRIAGVLAGQIGAEQDLARLAATQREIAAMRPAADAPMIALSANAISPTLPACEICTQVADAVFDFLAKYQLALHGDQAAQTDLAARRGFCGPHTAHFEAIAAPREICTGFAGVAEQQAARLRDLARRQPSVALACEAVTAVLPTAATCPACAIVRDATAQAATQTAARLPRNRSALRELSAICLPHLTSLLAEIGDPELVAAVLLRHADLLDRLAEDMRHFALKRDGMQRHLTTKEEVAAGERALRVLVGNPHAQQGPEAPRSGLAMQSCQRGSNSS